MLTFQAYQDVPEWLEECAEGAVGTDYGPAGGRFGSRDTRKQVCKFLLFGHALSVQNLTTVKEGYCHATKCTNF